MTDKRHTISVKPHTGTTAGQSFVAWCEGAGSPAPKYYGATEAEAIAKVELALGQAPMTDHNAPELLPCPFCGGKAELWRAHPHPDRAAWISCMGKCSVLVSKEHKTDAEAIAAWNTRADLLTAAQAHAEQADARATGLEGSLRQLMQIHLNAIADGAASIDRQARRAEQAAAEVKRLRDAIERTADQALTTEIPAGYGPQDRSKWAEGYDAAIRHTRAALRERGKDNG